MKATLINMYGQEPEYMIGGEKVLFQQSEKALGGDMTYAYYMDGYVGDEKKYEAVAYYDCVTDDFVEIIFL